ncbi:hypothetical protein ACRAWC_17665 [Leifsonia sp. L25]|uniref:hypothetical protein n=1 Tax=Actinomycetes TaxID=1760 RepID=UPI003D686EF5
MEDDAAGQPDESRGDREQDSADHSGNPMTMLYGEASLASPACEWSLRRSGSACKTPSGSSIAVNDDAVFLASPLRVKRTPSSRRAGVACRR